MITLMPSSHLFSSSCSPPHRATSPQLQFVMPTSKRFLPTTLPRKISRQPTTLITCTQKLKQLLESKMLEEARDFYTEMRSSGVELGTIVLCMLMDVFMKSGWVSDAFWVFEGMPDRNVVAWTSMISGCNRNGCPRIGFLLFVEMLEAYVVPNDFALNAALKACGSMEALSLGEQLHSQIVLCGLQGDARTANCLIDFYSRCGLMDKAELVFGGIGEPDVVSFTSLISGFCRNNSFESAVREFDKMVHRGFEPNERTISSILTACGLALGEQIHGYMIKTKIAQIVHSASALIDFYSRQYRFEQSKRVFNKLEERNVVTWSSMISGCLQNEKAEDALRIFCKMASEGVKPNEYTFAIVLGACGLHSEYLTMGRQLHCSAVKSGLEFDDHVHNSLLTMYARSGEIEELEKIFKEIGDPDVVSWCAAISGYFQNGTHEKATVLLCQMHRRGYRPNEYGLSSALSSCANLALQDQGKQFHCLALKLGCGIDVCVGNALINMYAKCGCPNDARLAFDVMHTHDVMSWNSLIHGYAHHGHTKEAIEVFGEMVETKHFTPDHSTFVGILAGCNHAGYVDQAIRYFKIMSDRYGVVPSISHYACMIDIMGRAGRLDEALHMINQMPFEPDLLIWKSLLGSCRLHRNLEVGKFAAAKVIELSPEDSASYVLLSNLHAMHAEWEDVERVRTMMEERGVKKDAGWSWIEIRSDMHTFVAGDSSHPRNESIHRMLRDVLKQMKDEGYSADMSSSVHAYESYH